MLSGYLNDQLHVYDVVTAYLYYSSFQALHSTSDGHKRNGGSFLKNKCIYFLLKLQSLLYKQETTQNLNKKYRDSKLLLLHVTKGQTPRHFSGSLVSDSYYRYYYTDSCRLPLFPSLFLRNRSLGVGA